MSRFLILYLALLLATTAVVGSATAPRAEEQFGVPPNSAGQPPSPECLIKGNVNREGERIYHLLGWPDYANIKMDRPEKRWFCSVAEAKAAGWRSAIGHIERLWQHLYCEGMELEKHLPSGGRIDCLSSEYAIEVEWAKHWAEAVGQSLYDAAAAGRKPGIILFVRSRKVPLRGCVAVMFIGLSTPSSL